MVINNEVIINMKEERNIAVSNTCAISYLTNKFSTINKQMWRNVYFDITSNMKTNYTDRSNKVFTNILSPNKSMKQLVTSKFLWKQIEVL